MIVSESRVVLGSDEGVILVQGGVGDPWEGSTLLAVQEEGAFGEGGSDLWVLTADQWGPFEVVVRVLDGAPGGLEDEWEDVAEVSLTSEAGFYITELVSQGVGTVVPCDPDTYRVRVSARGRSADRPETDEDGELPPRDELEVAEFYLIEVWAAPSSQPTDLRESSSFARATRAGPPAEPFIVEAAAGLAASKRIGRDVDGSPQARSLSGEVGVVTVSRRVSGTRRSLFKWFRSPITLSPHVSSWSFMSSGDDWDQVGGVTYGGASDHPDQLTGTRGLLRNVLVEEVRPARRVRTWAWLVPPDGQDGGRPDQRRPLFPRDSTIVTTFEQSTDEDGRPWTTIVIQHEGLPVEWVGDMHSWWAYQLALVESRADSR